MERPSTLGYTVYTKENCKYCRRVKDMLPAKTKVIACDDILRTDRDGFLAAMDMVSGAQQRTFPFVFHNGTFIGGCDDTEVYIGLQCSNF